MTTSAMPQIKPEYVHWFRNSAPYINTHRGKTFVIMFGGEAVNHPNFSTLIHDFALLHSLGIKLVLVHGARPQIEKNLKEVGITSPLHRDIRVTPRAAMPSILQAVGAIRLQIEAQLSMGLANSPMYGSRIDAVSGNFVTARPYGIRDGVDHQMTGEVRSIDIEAIKNNLIHDHIVILGSMGYSATGEVFNLLSEDVALSAAVALGADKLIFLGEEADINDNGRLLHEMIPNEVDRFLRERDLNNEINYFLHCASNACRQGVHRTHIISYAKDGALLEELFTRDGSGTLISHDPYEEIRHANIDDVVGLIELLTPLEEQGILVSRSRERLEQEIDNYSVIERDGMILGCAALYPLDTDAAEVACVAVHPEYRNGSRGADLLAFLEQQARSHGLHKLFVLTTRTAHWFVEQGFAEVDASVLPAARQEKYHNGRNSKVFQKTL
ncbi:MULTISPECIES: amino-acid N-acetyltransferase [unclassified Psychrobacter]|uniref:amino-acid N-acetyltransferase n=1 Tax=unclassified Psychrobacter TaxID=196806 RepID=UPI00078B94A7|nr:MULTISPECIES: amino-acid N-acetyltransferase [unclassified Psychrobacter]AMN50698.1 amino acid acetyltransferase [Psychrobacter sp. P2G3]AMN68598.1 amino acid acetyltransferase [Psychrobacter sp. P11G5]